AYERKNRAINNYLFLQSQNLRFLQHKLNNEKPENLTNKRVQNYIKAKKSNINALEKYLASFLEKSEQLVGDEVINPYEELILRDWCWETKENDLYSEFTASNTEEGFFVILGAGACRLSHELSLRKP